MIFFLQYFFKASDRVSKKFHDLSSNPRGTINQKSNGIFSNLDTQLNIIIIMNQPKVIFPPLV